MNDSDFLKHQFITLREEIRESKARIFKLVVLGALFVPAAGYAADRLQLFLASAAIPFVLVLLMLDFISEQNAIIRAGRYLKEHIEPKVAGVTGWEKWLESNHKLRSVDRYFFGSFLLMFFIFYGIASTAAIQSLSVRFSDDEMQFTLSCVAYCLGGLWVLFVWLRHWHSCTTTL